MLLISWINHEMIHFGIKILISFSHFCNENKLISTVNTVPKNNTCFKATTLWINNNKKNIIVRSLLYFSVIFKTEYIFYTLKHLNETVICHRIILKLTYSIKKNQEAEKNAF